MIIGVLYSLLSCNPAPGPHWARQPIRTRRALLVPPLVGPSHRDGNLLKRPSPRLRNATGFTSTSMRRAPRRMRQEFWRARAFPMISKRYRLVASLPHPRTGGSLPTLRFRFFRKRVRHVPQPADGAPGRKNVVKNSGTTVKNSTVKNRKSSVSYTITYFLLCFARQAWLLWRFGVRQPPKSGIQDPGSSCWMADGCTKLGREGAGTFQCPRPFYIGRSLTFPSRGTFQCRGSGPGKAPRHARKAYSKSWAAAAQPGPDPWH